jgi:hypothetical protein
MTKDKVVEIRKEKTAIIAMDFNLTAKTPSVS